MDKHEEELQNENNQTEKLTMARNFTSQFINIAGNIISTDSTWEALENTVSIDTFNKYLKILGMPY